MTTNFRESLLNTYDTHGRYFDGNIVVSKPEPIRIYGLSSPMTHLLPQHNGDNLEISNANYGNVLFEDMYFAKILIYNNKQIYHIKLDNIACEELIISDSYINNIELNNCNVGKIVFSEQYLLREFDESDYSKIHNTVENLIINKSKINYIGFEESFDILNIKNRDSDINDVFINHNKNNEGTIEALRHAKSDNLNISL